MIRSLYRPDPEGTGRVVYLNVDGLTNLAIAEGTVCRFTRVVGGGLEGMASELAVRRGIPVAEAHTLLAAVDLDAPAPAVADNETDEQVSVEPDAPDEEASEASLASEADHEAREQDMSFEELATVPRAPAPKPAAAGLDAAAREVLENGVHEISGEVRNSLDFHRSQDGGGEVSRVVLSGAAQGVAGFASALELSLGVEVRSERVDVADDAIAGVVSVHRLAVAAGLAATEAPQ